MRLDDVEVRRDRDTGVGWIPVRHALGVRAFGVNAWRAPRAGVEVIERHDEDAHEELYVVLRGSARFTVGGDEVAAPAGTVIFVSDPPLERVAVAEEEGTLILTVGAEPGAAFEVSEWERRNLA